MNKKLIGYLIVALVVGSMIVIMVKTNLEKPEPIDPLAAQIVPLDGIESHEESSIGGLEQGDTPPDFELTTLTGEKLRLSDLKGKKVMLNFWATWCPPCKAEMPHMQNYYENSAEKDNVEIVAVNLTTGENRGVKAVQEFVDSYGLTFPIPLDELGEVGDAYKAFQVPTTYMLNSDGTVAHKIIGPVDESTMEELIGNLE